MEETKALTKPEKIKEIVEQRFDRIAQLLPKHIDAKRYVGITLNALWKNEKLYDCEPFTLMKAIYDLAELGLEVGSYRGQACILPYWNEKKKCYEAQSQVMYQGLIDLAARSGEVVDIRARIVYEKDSFDYELGLKEDLRHKPYLSDEDRGNITHCYAIIRYKDGNAAFEVMSLGQIDKIKNKSMAVRKGWMSPWTDEVGYPEMIKKTVLKRLLKTVPKGVDKEIREVINKDEEREYGALVNSVSSRIEEMTSKRISKMTEKPLESNNISSSGQDISLNENKPKEPVFCSKCGYQIEVCNCAKESESPIVKKNEKKT